MTKLRYSTSFAAACGILATTLSASAIGAEAWTEWGVISWIDAGWKEDTMAVHLAAPTVNPDSCPFPDGGYATNPNDAGHSLFHTIALSALMNKRQVHFLISECAYGKPRIIGVGVR
jgi:hypothetical protein